MSQQNVEVVRGYFELIDRMLAEYWVSPVPLSEYPLDEAFRDLAWDAEWKPPHLAQPIRGRDGWLALISDWMDAADDWRISIEAVHDAGGDRVLGIFRNSIRGKDSGLHVDQRVFTVVTVRASKIVSIEDHTERSDALRAAGLDEAAEI